MILAQSKASLMPQALDINSLVSVYKGNETISPARYGLQKCKGSFRQL
jgi:hypothetical protein